MRNFKNNIRIEHVDFLQGSVKVGATKEKLKKRRKKQAQDQMKRILFLVILILVIVYVIGVCVSIKHFYGKDTVFGIKIARQTTESLKESVHEKVADYKLTIVARSGEEVITAEAVGLQFQDDGVIEELKEQQRSLLWFAGLFKKSTDVPIRMEYDETKMTETLENLLCLSEEAMISPEDAHLEYIDTEFQIVKEEMGTTLDVQGTAQRIRDAIIDGETVLDLDAEGRYTDPVIYEDSKELASLRSEVNQLIDVTIVYDFADRSETVDSAKIAKWIVFGDDFSYELSEELVKDYVKELGRTYDTFGLSHSFTTSGGKTITLTKGDYGWCINKSETTEELIGLIQAGESVTTEPVYLYKGKDRSTNDIGDTYVEVSLSQQRMWCYVDGTCIVDTPVVTGTKGVADRETPSGGVWAIDAKMVDYYLVGQGYNTHVDYWMPFNGNVGIHDASWRDSFGGSIYLTNGSHGCVNTPYKAAKKIYENVSIGTPVIVY